MLAPKHESSDISKKECYFFHATNSIQQSPESRDKEGKPLWRFEILQVHGWREGTVISRILVAKLPGNKSLDTYKLELDKVLSKVPVIQHDPTWNCVTWLKHASVMLRDGGGDLRTIPEITDQVEKEIRDFGAESKEKVLRGQTKLIKHVADLPHMDLRVKA